MFSGIVEELAKVEGSSKWGKSIRLTLDLRGLSRGVKVGDSVSVNGVCLTVSRMRRPHASFDAMPETLRRTNLGGLRPGDKVNIERSLKLGDEIGGHFVTGHIDFKAEVLDRKDYKDYTIMWIKSPTGMMIPKGSVAVDGISLTLVDIKKGRFSVYLIPHTLKVTTLGFKKKSDTVNIEIDMIGKWVKKLLEDMNVRRA